MHKITFSYDAIHGILQHKCSRLLWGTADCRNTFEDPAVSPLFLVCDGNLKVRNFHQGSTRMHPLRTTTDEQRLRYSFRKQLNRHCKVPISG